MKTKNKLLFIIIFFIQFVSFYSQNSISQKNESNIQNLTGTNLCFLAENFINENGFSSTRLQLSETGWDVFPFNLSLDFQSNIITSKNLIIDITQENLILHKDFFQQLFDFIKKNEFSYNIQFIFTTNDNPLSFTRNFSLTGTQNFASTNDFLLTDSVLILDFLEDEKALSNIYTTGIKKSSPLWLTKLAVNAFNKEKTKFNVPQKHPSLYRLSLIFGESKLESFFMNSIDAIKIDFSKEDSLPVLKRFLLDFENDEQLEKETHYYFFNLPFFNTIFINEKTNIIALEIFGILGIFFLCTFSFSGRKRLKFKKAFLKSWYFVPLTLIVCFFSLELSEKVFKSFPIFFDANPLILFCGKIVFSVIAVSVLFGFILKFTKKLGNFIFGFLISVIAVINVFVFSVYDITLFYLFLIEFIVIYSFRNSNKLIPLLISLIFMALPFLPYAIEILKNASLFEMRRIIFCSKWQNVLLALIFLPFQFFWLKVLKSLKVFNTKYVHSFKKTAFYTSISALIIIGISWIFIILLNQFTFKKNISSENTIIVQSEAKSFEANYSKDNYLHVSSEILTIESKIPALRYEVSLSSSDYLPVLDSVYDYDIKQNSKRLDFLLPDFPPQKISINYATDSKSPKTFKISCWYQENENTIRKENLTLEIPGLINSKNGEK